MSRLGSTLSTLGQVAQSAGGKIGSAMKAGKQAKDTIMASKTFKSLQGTMQGLLKVQGSMAKQSKKAGALQFLQQENEKEYQKEQMEFWSILLQKLDSIEKKLDGLGLGAGKGEKKGLLAKLWNFAMGLLGLANAISLIRPLLSRLLISIGNLGKRIANLTRRVRGLPEKPIEPKPGEVKPTEEVKPKTPKEISEEAKRVVTEQETRMQEVRAELEKVYDRLHRTNLALEENARQLEKAGGEGDAKATERLREMREFIKEDIRKLEKTINETKEKLTTAQEKLV